MFGVTWINTDSVSTRPIFSINDWPYQPWGGGTIVQCNLSALLIPDGSGKMKHLYISTVNKYRDSIKYRPLLVELVQYMYQLE